MVKKSKNAAKILIKPLITEKSAGLAAQNKYVFMVAKEATKPEITKAVAAVYGVTPKDINVLVNPGKSLRRGWVSGRTKSWKKAIVTLKQGDKIEIYEGV